MDCCFCREFSPGAAVNPPPEYLQSLCIKDRIVESNGSFVAAPTLGGFIRGYLLLISRAHVSCLKAMPETQLAPLVSIRDEMLSRISERLAANCVIFEHGALSPQANGSNSVDHLHLHVVPFRRPLWKKISSAYAVPYYIRAENIYEVHALLQTAASNAYLYFMDVDGCHYVVPDSSAFPSQFFRRVLASETGRKEDWNWKTAPFFNHLLATYRLLR